MKSKPLRKKDMSKTKYLSNSELEQYLQFECIFLESQLEIIRKKTPSSEIEEKTDEQGNKYKSVKAAYIKKLVQIVTGGSYNFEIK